MMMMMMIQIVIRYVQFYKLLKTKLMTMNFKATFVRSRVGSVLVISLEKLYFPNEALLNLVLCV